MNRVKSLNWAVLFALGTLLAAVAAYVRSAPPPTKKKAVKKARNGLSRRVTPKYRPIPSSN